MSDVEAARRQLVWHASELEYRARQVRLAVEGHTSFLPGALLALVDAIGEDCDGLRTGCAKLDFAEYVANAEAPDADR